MAQLFTNNASAFLALDITAGDTAIQVESGMGSLFPDIDGSDPSEFSILALEDVNGQLELCKLVTRSTDILTVERAYENTTALAFTVADLTRVELRVTAETLRNVQSGGGIGEAPVDGKPYNRQDAGWVEAAGGASAGQVKITSGDNSGGFLQEKLLAGDNVTLVKETDPQGDETLTINSTGGDGIQVPTDVPVPIGGVVTYKDTDGTAAEGNPSAMILGGHKLESTDTVVLDISSLLGAGTTLHLLPGGGGSSLRIEVPAEPGPDNPMKVTSEGAALEIDGDGGVMIQEMLWDMRAPETAGGYVTAVSEDTLQLSAATGPSTPSVVGSGFIP